MQPTQHASLRTAPGAQDVGGSQPLAADTDVHSDIFDYRAHCLQTCQEEWPPLYFDRLRLAKLATLRLLEEHLAGTAEQPGGAARTAAADAWAAARLAACPPCAPSFHTASWGVTTVVAGGADAGAEVGEEVASARRRGAQAAARRAAPAEGARQRAPGRAQPQPAAPSTSLPAAAPAALAPAAPPTNGVAGAVAAAPAVSPEHDEGAVVEEANATLAALKMAAEALLVSQGILRRGDKGCRGGVPWQVLRDDAGMQAGAPAGASGPGGLAVVRAQVRVTLL